MIKIRNVDIDYEKQMILKDVNLDLKENQFHAILGRNGSGKTTLLKTLAHIKRINNGQIILDNININTIKQKEIAKQIAYVAQQTNSDLDISVLDLVACGRYPYQNPFMPLTDKDYELINWAIQITGLDEYKDVKITNLSGGQLQRAYIAMSLAQDTKYIFLDEPTNNLDLEYQYQIMNLLKELVINHNKTIITIIHDVNLALKYADNVVIIDQNQIKYSGNPSEILTKELIKDIYHIDCEIYHDKLGNKFIIPC